MTQGLSCTGPRLPTQEPSPQMTNRLIEAWLPIAELGEESMRERRSMTALPPIYYLHVWWARRPLVASRAAVLASLLPADADRKTFMHMLGIHGDPVAAKRRIAKAKKMGENLGPNPYGYSRSFQHSPSEKEKLWLLEERRSWALSSPSRWIPLLAVGRFPLRVSALAAKLWLTTSTLLQYFSRRPLLNGPTSMDWCFLRSSTGCLSAS